MKFVVNGTEYTMVESKFTFAEARAIEKVTGYSFQQIMEDPSKQNSTTMQAMFWVSMKRVDPVLAFTALDDLAIDDIEILADPDDEPEEESVEPDPTEGVAGVATP